MAGPRATWLLVIVAAAGLIPLAARAPRPDVEGVRSANFGLEDYRALLRRARGTTAIARRGGARPFATGVLLAPELVLTCRHATHKRSGSDARHPPTSLEVRIQVAEVGETGKRPVWQRFPVLAYAHTSNALDLCVLRIGPDEGGRLPEPDRVQVLSRTRAGLGAPLYAVHHPRGGALQVADDARVLFPFEATREEVDLLAARAETGDVRAAIRRSYRKSAGPHLRNYSERWAGQPVIGADCRTFDGSSGAPVYLKRDHALVGILFAGVDPRQRRIASKWAHHEAILPAPAILDDLARSPDPACRALAGAGAER